MPIDLQSRSGPPWWMNPYVLSLALMIPLLTAAWLVPVEFHWELRRAVKFLNLHYYVLGLAGVLAFASGAFLTANATPRLEGLAIAHVVATPALRRLLKMASWGLFAVTIGAYALWFAPLARDPSYFTDILAGRWSERNVRETIASIPGITTLVQAQVPYATLIALRWVYFPPGSLSRLEKFAFAIVLCLGIMRNFVWSERLAVIEFMMPLAVLLLRKPRYPLLTALGPFVGFALLLTFFGTFEYFRSWLAFYQYQYDSFIKFIITRVSAYYITALDNGAGMVRDFGGLSAPAMTADWFWHFPWEIGQTALGKVLHVGVRDYYTSWLYWNATEEFNNAAGIFMPFVDFGAGGLVFWFLFGMLTGLIFRSFAHGNFAGMLLYPSWFVGILEMPRLFYNGETRYFPIMIITMTLIFLVSMVAAQEIRSTSKRRLL